ncbi:hypothetical protein EG68_02394 [Paragonimus skrjabini miyazakii]|uniref:Uncharacterized protein n=1 Tax=Paragonimus skrjabini miyazakii TaxID=59628 RepID=A0A8S9Z4P3_9TREM|nr:hypothetical protein EG68_02394 [Paragonimus skrjabini miyazakii]
MDIVFPDAVCKHPLFSQPATSSIMFIVCSSSSSSSVDRTENTNKLVHTALLLNVANEAACRNLRTVYIRKEPMSDQYMLHLHGTSQMDTAYWENIHFMNFPDEISFIRWFSRSHLARRFADLIIVEDMRTLFSWDSVLSSDLLRLTSLMDDTRQFIHSHTDTATHGHGCRLLVTCELPDGCESHKLPIHNLSETLLFTPEGSDNQFSLVSHTQRWRLDLSRCNQELFWTSFHPIYDRGTTCVL